MPLPKLDSVPFTCRWGSYRRDSPPVFDRSVENLDAECPKSLQLHVPPTAVRSVPELFGAPDTMAKDGRIQSYGGSVKKAEEIPRRSTHQETRLSRSVLMRFTGTAKSCPLPGQGAVRLALLRDYVFRRICRLGRSIPIPCLRSMIDKPDPLFIALGD